MEYHTIAQRPGEKRTILPRYDDRAGPMVAPKVRVRAELTLEVIGDRLVLRYRVTLTIIQLINKISHHIARL